MGDLLPRLRRWWDSARPSWTGRRVSYAVACRCGHALHGQRGRRHQVIPCPKCAQPVFILPYSAYPAVHQDEPGSLKKKPGPLPRSSRRAWQMPLAAALATLALAVVFFLWIWPSLKHTSTEKQLVAPAPRAEYDRAIAEGQHALAEGSFAFALKQFTAAVCLRDERPGLRDSDERRRLNQLYWQSNLLANQLDRPRFELLREAHKHAEEKAWQAQFELQYRGKTIIFDDVIEERDGKRSLRDGSVVRWREDGRQTELRASVDLSDLKLLEQLPLEQPQRWIFGARLKSFRGEEKEWVIQFEPDSGVLLTDADAVLAWKPALRDDKRLSDVLDRQGKLMRQLLVPEP